MLNFYFSKGSSALAAHILLEEVGAEYNAIEVSIAKAEHQSPEFLRRNPKGRVPLLETLDGIITENPAILEYIAATHPAANCLLEGAFAQAQARSFCAYLCATAHVAAAHRHRGHRWAKAEASIRDMQSTVPRNLMACAEVLEDGLASGQWVMGDTYTMCDPYLFQFSRWLAAAEVQIENYPRLTAHREAMRARAATQTALKAHGLT